MAMYSICSACLHWTFGHVQLHVMCKCCILIELFSTPLVVSLSLEVKKADET